MREKHAFISAHAPNPVILRCWSVMEKRKGTSEWVNPKSLMGALWKGPSFLGLTLDIYRSFTWKKKVGRCFHIEIQKFSFWILWQGADGLLILWLGQNPFPSQAYTNCVSCSDTWSAANLFEHFGPAVSLQGGGEKQKTATLTAGVCFTVTWANLVLGAVCHSDTLLMLLFYT